MTEKRRMVMEMDDAPIRELLGQGIREGVFTAAALAVARNGETVVRVDAGTCSREQESAEVGPHTIFDLASLTKPLATTPALISLVDKGRIGLDQPLEEIIPGVDWPGSRGRLTPRLLLAHAAGLPDWRPYYRELEGGRASERKQLVRRWILDEPQAYEPGRACVYSDLGFILLEWVVEEVSGMSFSEYVASEIYRPLGLERTFLWSADAAAGFARGEFAATEDCPWRGRLIQGEVHDENAWALGGHSGHSGLFGTAAEVLELAGMFRDHYMAVRRDVFRPAAVREFLKAQGHIQGCGRALGWDIPATEGSAAGRFFSRRTFGHLGFTGTSLWMDLAKDVVVVFLSNRVHAGRESKGIHDFRPRLHDKVMEEIGAL
jgi:CubicO group peptidase (beta-lactamase class C family)